MPCVERLKHIDRFLAPDFPDNDPVRAHPQTGPDQVPDAHGVAAFIIGRAGFQPDQILDALDLKLAIVLDGDNTLLNIVL